MKRLENTLSPLTVSRVLAPLTLPGMLSTPPTPLASVNPVAHVSGNELPLDKGGEASANVEERPPEIAAGLSPAEEEGQRNIQSPFTPKTDQNTIFVGSPGPGVGDGRSLCRYRRRRRQR